MAKFHHLLRLLIAAESAALLVLTTTDAGGDFIWSPVNCRGSMADCVGGELEMDTEINRRMLGSSEYISYGSLQANNVPCSWRGASYYNCQPGAEANPYTRSCTAATQCRS